MRTFVLLTFCAGIVGTGATIEPYAPAASAIVFTGEVTDAGAGSPIVGVLVSIEATSYGGLTDSSGRYRFTAPAALRGTTVRVVARMLGYAEDGRQVRVSADTPSEDLRFAAAVASFGMLLRNSPRRGDATYESVLAIASSAIGDDPGGYRREFLRLVESAQTLDKRVTAR